MPFKPPTVRGIKLPKPGKLVLKPRAVKVPKLKVKHAGVEQFAKSPEAVGAAIGAGVLFGVQALSNIKGKDGLSAQQRAMRNREREIEHDLATKEEAGSPLSFRDKVRKVTAKPYSQLADVATEHPFRSALKMGVTGAAGGAAVARILTKRAGAGLAAPPNPMAGAAPKMPKVSGSTGASSMPGMPKMPSMPGMPKMAQERLELADSWGRELAKEAWAGNMAVGQAIRGIMKSRWGGAGVGAAVGAARYAMSDDPNKSFVGSVGGGAMVGAMGHQALKGGIGMAAKSRSQVGHFVRDSNRMAGQAERMLAKNPKADISGIKGTEMNWRTQRREAFKKRMGEISATRPTQPSAPKGEVSRYPAKPPAAGPDDALIRAGATPDHIKAMRASGMDDSAILAQVNRTKAAVPPPQSAPPAGPPKALPQVTTGQTTPPTLTPPPAQHGPQQMVSPVTNDMIMPPPLPPRPVSGPVRPPGQPPAQPAVPTATQAPAPGPTAASPAPVPGPTTAMAPSAPGQTTTTPQMVSKRDAPKLNRKQRRASLQEKRAFIDMLRDRSLARLMEDV